MKSVRNDTIKRCLVTPFPKLMVTKNSNNIYLMWDSSTGVMVNCGKGTRLGKPNHELGDVVMEDYLGNVTLYGNDYEI